MSAGSLGLDVGDREQVGAVGLEVPARVQGEEAAIVGAIAHDVADHLPALVTHLLAGRVTPGHAHARGAVQRLQDEAVLPAPAAVRHLRRPRHAAGARGAAGRLGPEGHARVPAVRKRLPRLEARTGGRPGSRPEGQPEGQGGQQPEREQRRTSDGAARTTGSTCTGHGGTRGWDPSAEPLQVPCPCPFDDTPGRRRGRLVLPVSRHTDRACPKHGVPGPGRSGDRLDSATRSRRRLVGAGALSRDARR